MSFMPQVPTPAHDVAFGANSARLYPMKVIVCGLGRTGTTSKYTFSGSIYPNCRSV